MSRENHKFHLHISKRRRLNYIDKIAMVAAFLYPLSSIPQIIEVFKGHTDGVSLFTWLSYILFASLFLAYGTAHKIKPMIISNSIWILMDASVVAGILWSRL